MAGSPDARLLEVIYGVHRGQPERGIGPLGGALQLQRHWRPVVNRVAARFRFRDGLIVEHIDSFGFWRWSSQALGPVEQRGRAQDDQVDPGRYCRG